MKQKIQIILILTALISCHSKSNKSKTDNPVSGIEITDKEKPTFDDVREYEPYDYDTTLNGGYNLSYKVHTDQTSGEELQSLSLMKANKEIKVLNETSYPMLLKNLGYIAADFDDCFVFAQSFGSGNPTYIQLIDKETGIEIRKGTWVDANEKEQVLLYIEDEHSESEFLKIYDIKKNKEIIVGDFNDSKCVEQEIGGLRNCVAIDTVTQFYIVLKVDSDVERLRKKYNR